MTERSAEGVLLDLDYLSWTGPDTGDRAAELELLGQNLAAVTANYRRAGLEDLTISNDRPIANVAEDVLTFLGWPQPTQSTPKREITGTGSRPGSCPRPSR